MLELCLISSWSLGHVSFTVKGPSLVPASSVGTDGWKRWLERMEKLKIGIYRIYLSDGWNAQFKKRQTYLAYLFDNTLK